MTASQSERDNLALVRRGFDAFATGDMAALTEPFAVDAVLKFVPTGVLAGNYRGRDQVFAWFGQLYQETNGTFRTTPTAFANASALMMFIPHAASTPAMVAKRRGLSAVSSISEKPWRSAFSSVCKGAVPSFR